MIHFDDETGRRALARIQTESTIWLTTVSQSGIPQPRPVWFVWDGADFIVYSNSRSKKLAHIAANPNVSLHFNTDAEGYDVQVILGIAKVDPLLPPANRNVAYAQKYGVEILALDMDAEKYARLFNVGIRISPNRLRGLEPLPEE